MVSPEKAYAAGVPPGVMVSLRRGVEQMGVVRTAKAFAQLNQRKGFDCPRMRLAGDTRSSQARRVLRERRQGGRGRGHPTSRRPPRSSPHTPVSELLGKSDYWLGQQGRLTHPMA